MKKTILIAALIGLMATNNGKAQTKTKRPVGPGVIKGFVMDTVAKKTIPYATIAALDPKDSTMTAGAVSNNAGGFEISGLPVGNYLVKMSFLGYKKVFIRNVEITNDNKVINLGKIHLQEAGINTDEIKIVADKELVTYEIDKKVVNVSQNATAQGGSAVEALNNVPSVSVDQEGNVALRGSTNFQVLVDGRPTSMQGTQLLKQIPASAIDKIEIITNPSAKYDPDGTTGIINVVLKKDVSSRYNGALNASAGTRDKYNSDAMFNVYEETYWYYLGGEYGDNKNYPKSSFVREAFNKDTVQYVSNDANRIMGYNGGKISLGIEKNWNPTHISAFEMEFGKQGYSKDSPTNYRKWYNLLDVENFTSTESLTEWNGKYAFVRPAHEIYLNDKAIKIEINGTAVFIDGANDFYVRNYNTNSNFEKVGNLVENHRSNQNEKRSQVKTNLSADCNLGEGERFEGGFQTEFINSDANYIYEDLNLVTGVWNKNATFSNDNKFSHQVYSLFATYTSDIWGIGYKLGLRSEYYNRDFNQKTTGDKYNFNQINFYPTLHASYNLTEASQIQASYSRRVQRPNERILNPFADYADDYYVSVGNPKIKPEFSDAVELNYQQSFGQSYFTVETFYRQTQGLWSRIMTLKDDGKLWITTDNVNKDYMTGAEVSVNIVPITWLRFNVSGSFYKYSLDEIKGSANTTSSNNVFDGNVFTTVNITSSTLFQLTLNYKGKKIIAEGEQDEVFMTGLALRQDLFDRKLTVTLSGRDIFGTGKYKFNNSSFNYRSYGQFVSEPRHFNLSLSYRINDYKKAPRQENVDMDYKGGGF